MTRILAALVNGAVLSAILTAAVWLLLRVAPRRMLNAATRYAIWGAVLAIVVLLPVAYMPGHSEPVVELNASAPVVESTHVASVATVPPDVSPVESEAVVEPPSLWPRFPVEIAVGAWPARILMAWAAIAVIMLFRLAISCVLLERRKAHAFAPPVHLAARMADWLAICGTQRRITLAASSEIATPIAAGPRRASILIPAGLFAELDGPELDQIGLHEVAHLARRDDYALIIQRAIEAVFALHPVVRFIARSIDLEREIACDDFVVEATGRARNYAVCLTRIVELSGGVRGSLVAAAATEERSHLARRVEMLLDRTRHTGTRLLKARLTAVMAALVALAWMAAKTPGVVAFAMPLDQTIAQVPEPPQPPLPPILPAAHARPAPAAAQAAPEAPASPEPPPAFLDAAEAQEPPIPPTPAAAPIPPAAPAPPAPPFAGSFAPPAPPAPQQPPPVPSAPAPTAPPTPPARQGNYSGSFDQVDWHWRDGLSARDLRIHGAVEFTDDDSDVKSVSPGGWFSYEESHGFSSRRYQVMGDSTMTRRYIVDGREHALDEEARAWLRGSIPEMLRESGIDAPARVRRIMRQGGAQAVLAEIGKIHSGGAKRRYIQELVPIGNLNTDQYQMVLRIVRALSSDGDKAGMVIFLAKYTLKDNLRDHLFDAIATINSSGDRRRALMAIAQEDPARATLIAVAKSAEGIASDGDKAGILVQLAQHYRGNEDMRRPFFRAAESINSSGDRARVLVAVIEDAGDHRDTLVDALRATAGIPADGDKARVLANAVGYWKDDDGVRRAFFDAANAVNSSGDHARVLLAVASRAGVGPSSLIEVVRSADRIPSDGDKGRVLSNVIGRSDSSSEVLIAAVQSAARLSSDGDKARVLVEAVQHSSGKPAVRNEIRTAVKTLHSDGDYRRVMSALDRQTAL